MSGPGGTLTYLDWVDYAASLDRRRAAAEAELAAAVARAEKAEADAGRDAAVRYMQDALSDLIEMRAERDAAVARAEKAEALLHRLADGDSEYLVVLQQWRRPVAERDEP